MKDILTRFAVVAAIVLCWPLLVFASGESMERDVLLSPDGTLYTVESVAPDALPSPTHVARRLFTDRAAWQEVDERCRFLASLAAGCTSSRHSRYDETPVTPVHFLGDDEQRGLTRAT